MKMTQLLKAPVTIWVTAHEDTIYINPAPETYIDPSVHNVDWLARALVRHLDVDNDARAQRAISIGVTICDLYRIESEFSDPGPDFMTYLMGGMRTRDFERLAEVGRVQRDAPTHGSVPLAWAARTDMGH